MEKDPGLTNGKAEDKLKKKRRNAILENYRRWLHIVAPSIMVVFTSPVFISSLCIRV